MGNFQEDWKEWNPGLEVGDLTLKEVLDTLPGYRQDQIHFLVKLLENPDSKFALPGSISLFNHDCVHILLGRGLLAQDEAFVIGFTMGSSGRMNHFYRLVYEFAASRLYPKIYRFGEAELKVYELGLKAGNQSGVKELHKTNFETMLDWKICEIRKFLNIDETFLLKCYEEEALLVPMTRVTQRLPKRNDTGFESCGK